jgi:hypothetical protein
VDNLGTSPADSTKPTHRPGDPSTGHDQRTALRAGSEASNGPDWALTVPTSGFTRLIAADWLRRRLPIFARCSRKLVRHPCKPYWAAGWTNRDIAHAMDHRPGLFGQATGVLICPERIAAPAAFIRSRLAAWRRRCDPARPLELPAHRRHRHQDRPPPRCGPPRPGRRRAAPTRRTCADRAADHRTRPGRPPPGQPRHPRGRPSHPRRAERSVSRCYAKPSRHPQGTTPPLNGGGSS